MPADADAVVLPPFRAPVDLDNCDREPIHVPGAIQPHGVLIAVSEPDLVVRIVSENIAEWFGRPAADAIGRPLVDLVGDEAASVVAAASITSPSRRIDDVALALAGVAGPLDATATLHRTDAHLIVEAEVDLPTGRRVSSLVRDATTLLQSATSVPVVASAAAQGIRLLTGFDRVMVYRFDEEWNGEVIAEEKLDRLNSFFGLHYPATDIPAQARELYRRNWIRLIPDISYTPVMLDPAVAYDSERPLDLSLSVLRSVSPIHVEYLTNMGVTASMSVSIIVDGELWGLIACHHYNGDNRPTVAERNACEFLGQLISLRMGEVHDAAMRERTAELAARSDSLGATFAGASPNAIDLVLRERSDDLLALTRSTGAAVVVGDRVTALGVVPPTEIVERLHARFAVERGREASSVSTPDLDPALADIADVACGVLAVPLSDDWSDAVLWFRPEYVRTVDWGGDPHNAKIARDEGDGVRLSPRKSFERWRETVRGRSEPWLPAERRAAARFAHHLRGVLLRRARESATFADDFQRTMLPDRLPDLDGYLFDASYAPAAGRVGGDWYDALVLDDHTVAALLGDIAGHGLGATAEMAQLRNVLRAYLFDALSPGQALDHLNRFMLRVLPRSMATSVCALIDTTSGALTLAHAGHLPALIVTTDPETGLTSTSFVDTGRGTLLGIRSSDRPDVSARLAPGDTLVLYSDGLVERRGETLDDGLRRLRSVALDVFDRTPAAGVARELAFRLAGAEPDDDVTVLVVHRAA